MELTIDQALQQGIAAHEEGKLQDAERLYRAVLQSQPSHPDANHNLGVLAVSVGKVQEALTHLKLALETNPKQGQFWLSYIDALIKLGQVDNARQLLQQGKASGLKGEKVDQLEVQLSSIANSNSPVIANTSNPSKKQIDELVILYKQGKLQEAIVQANTLARQFPNNAIVQNVLGAIYKALGRHGEAIASYNKAIELKPDFAEAYNNLGAFLSDIDKYEKSVTSLVKVVKLNPYITEAWYNLGNALKNIDQNKEAIISYSKAIGLKPDYAEAYNNLGVILNELGKYEEAIKSLNKAIKLKPDLAEAYNNLGTAFNYLGNYKEAINSCTRAIELKPDFAGSYNNLGIILDGLDYYEEAIVSYNKAIEIQPDYTEAYSNLSKTLTDLGRHEEAIISLNKAITLKPDYAEAYNNLGNALNGSGRYKEAIIVYNQAIILQPKLIQPWSNIIRPLITLKTFSDSIDTYISAIPKPPSSLSVKRELTILQYQLNRNSSEKEEFFNELKGIIRETPNFSIKNPDRSDASIESHSASIPERVFALKHFGRSGTGFFHSLIDNHKEISTLPSIYFSEFFNHTTWDRITDGGWSELADRFIAMYPVLFDARVPDPILSIGGQRLYDIGVKEGMANVGESRNEYLSVDKQLFRDSLTRYLSFYNDINAYSFFKLVHIAYEEAQKNHDDKKYIFYHIHNPDIYAKLKFIDLVPEARWIVMVREPLQSCESWIRSDFNNNNYKELSLKISSMLFDVDDFIFQKQNNIGVRLEDLIQEPKKTMKTLCQWMGIREESSLYEMTAQGKKWWGDTSSPDFGENGQSAFNPSSIKRQVGSIFSENDQFILKTLFYPFRTRFKYVDENPVKFKNNLKTIRPMINQMFDFEKTVADRQGIDPKDFIKLGFYLYLRARMIERWETLNEFHTYPNMLEYKEI